MARTRKLSKKLASYTYHRYVKFRYQKYRLQFPRVRESDIVDKIVKEWESFGD
jgi:hypothetical protein